MMKRQEQGTKWERMKKLCYDPETKKILGRDGKNWALIFIFYVIAYSLLLGFWCGMIAVFLNACITFDKPTLTGMHSILKLNPGMAYMPRLDVLTTFNQFTAYPSSVNSEYVQRATAMLQKYSNTVNTSDCSSGIGPKFPDTPCRFPVSTLGVCQHPDQAVAEGAPCFYLRMNRIYGWLPNLHNRTEFDKILVECSGQNAIDTSLLGQPKYHPEITGPDNKTYGYIDTQYFPFIRQPNYQNPLTAVQFPEVHKNTVVLVECHVRGLTNSRGFVHFELCVDSKVTLPTPTNA